MHDSMQSAESLRGQTPSRSKEFSGSQKAIGSGVMLSNGPSKTKSFSLPKEAMAKITNGHNVHRVRFFFSSFFLFFLGSEKCVLLEIDRSSGSGLS